jgi:hypothetical protein
MVELIVDFILECTCIPDQHLNQRRNLGREKEGQITTNERTKQYAFVASRWRNEGEQ